MSSSSFPTIEFVYFDLGNILLSFDPAIACENLARLVSRDTAAVKHALYQSGLQDKFEHGSISEERFVAELNRHLDVAPESVEDQSVLDAISDMFTPIDAMSEILGRVRSRVGRIGLLSNTCRAHWGWIGRQGYPVLETPLDETVLSFDVGSMKPEPAIYEAAEAMCEVDPSRVLFIDDREENVAAARARRWNAEVCLGGPEAIDVLGRYRVL